MRRVIEAFGKHVTGVVTLGSLSAIPRSIEDFPPDVRKRVSSGTHKLLWANFLVTPEELELKDVLGKIRKRNSIASGVETNYPEYPVRMLTGNNQLIIVGPPAHDDLLPVSVFHVVDNKGVSRIRRSMSNLLGVKLRPAHRYVPAEE